MRNSTDEGRLDALVTTAALRDPDRVAVIDDGRTVTYGGLEAEIRTLADALKAAGVRPGDRVGIYQRKGYQAILSIYAVLRAGAVAAPLDCADPVERTSRMATGSGLAFLLVSPRTREAALTARTRAAAEAGQDTEADPVDLPSGVTLLPLAADGAREATDEDSGYVLFTSGSTGWPKGVLLSHRNVLHFVRWVTAEFGVMPSDTIGSQASLTFDLSTFDIFGSALAGAALTLMPDEIKPFPRDVVGWLAEERVSIFYAVPTLYQMMMEKGGLKAESLPALRIAAFAGEPFPPNALQAWVDMFGTVEFFNLYGPTETNVCTYEKIPAGWKASDGISIGVPLPGLLAEPVDDEGKPAAEGEIAVAGPAVFLSYLQYGKEHDPTRQITFSDGVTRRAYLTGDIGYLGDDGRLHLKGRRDSQVKLRGYRIDLGDVESAALSIPAISNCAALVRRPEGADQDELWLYVVADTADREALDASLVSLLPPRMLPNCTVFLAELPVNARGKIDRLALAAAGAE